MAGIPVDGARFATYVLCAVLAAVCGFLLACFSGGAALSIGAGYLLMSIAVVVIGGTAVAGGDSTVPGIWGASLFMFLGVSMLNTYGLGAGFLLISTGLIIIAVILLASGRQSGGRLGGTKAMIYEIDDPRFRGLHARLDRGGLGRGAGVVCRPQLPVVQRCSEPAHAALVARRAGRGVSVFGPASNFANGQTRDGQGRLVSCEHGTRRGTRTKVDGRITVIADSYRGKRLNSPNVVVRSDGSIWFTDPTDEILSDDEG